MPYGIMPDSARQEKSAITYGLINNTGFGQKSVGGPEVGRPKIDSSDIRG
jgi:hypothetical protein